MIRMGEHEFEANLMSLDIHDFDVILFMDWLEFHYTTVDCFKKKVVFKKTGNAEVKFCRSVEFYPHVSYLPLVQDSYEEKGVLLI